MKKKRLLVFKIIHQGETQLKHQFRKTTSVVSTVSLNFGFKKQSCLGLWCRLREFQLYHSTPLANIERLRRQIKVLNYTFLILTVSLTCHSQ